MTPVTKEVVGRGRKAYFSAMDLVLIGVLGGASVLIVGLTVQPLTALSAGLLPPTFWAGMSFQFFAVLTRSLVGRHGVNTFVGGVVGALGIVLLPIGLFALIACPTQGLIHDIMFLGLRDKTAKSSWRCFLAAGIGNACFTLIVMYFFFGKGVSSPLLWWVPLTGLSGGIFGFLGYLTGRRVIRLAPQWGPKA